VLTSDRAGVLDPDASDHAPATANRNREQRTRAGRAQIAPGEPGGPGVFRSVVDDDVLAALEGFEQLRILGAPDLGRRRMAVAFVVVAVQAGDRLMSAVELPQSDPPRRERP